MNNYSNATLTRADNGYILCYNEKVAKGEYDFTYKPCKEVFKDDEGSEALERLDAVCGYENDSDSDQEKGE